MNSFHIASIVFATILLSSIFTFTIPVEAIQGPEFTISSKADQQHRTLDATWHAGTGQFLVVWSEHPDHSTNGAGFHNGNDQIRGQLVTLSSTLAGGDFLISEGGDSKDFPEVAHVGHTVKPAQQISLVVWQDDRDGGKDIWAQLLDSTGGALQGSNFKISGADRDLFPALTYAQVDGLNGRFLVVWEREIAADDSEIYGQLVRGATNVSTENPGDIIGGNFQISTAGAGFASSSSVAFDPVNAQYLVVWWDDKPVALDNDIDIFGQFVDTNGALVGGNFQISSQTGFEIAPKVVYHPEQQEYFVVWTSEPVIGGTHDVQAQRISPAGALLGGVIDIAVTGGQEEAGDIAIHVETGSYVIPMTTGPSRVDRDKVEIEKVSATGNLLGVRQEVPTNNMNNKGGSVAVYGSTPIGPGAGVSAVSEVLVVWRDSRGPPADGLLSPDVFGRMVEVLSDTDGDGLLDNWETDGFVDMNDNGVLDAGDFDFTTLPAANRPDVNHKDIYVEVDCMQVDADSDGVVIGDLDSPGDHTHCPIAVIGSVPTGTALDAVITSFANAPVANPDGTQGINLHPDIGQLGGGGPIAETTGVNFFTGFEGVKTANFAADRSRVFHYGLFKHEGSGRGEIWGNDFWVGAQYNTALLQGGGFMHELGHNLGLRHGGGDNINCKPNLFSIISYSFQLAGIPPTFRLDYSSQNLPALDEANLNENIALGDANDHIGDAIDQTIFQAGASTVGPNANTAGNVAINWDNDRTTGETGGDVGNNNINNIDNCAGSPANEILNGFDDWANLRYNWHSSPNVDDGNHIFPPEPDVLDEMKDFFRQLYDEPSLSMTKTGTTSGIPGDSVSYDITIDNAGPGPARKIIVEDTWPDGLTFTGSSIAPITNVLNPDGSRTLQWVIELVESQESVTITLDGTIDFPPVGDFVSNSVIATGHNVLGEAKPQLSDSIDTDIQVPEIEVTKTATLSVDAGEMITYMITYENVGDANADDVVITDTLPENVYYSIALDQGSGPVPDLVTSNLDDTTTLTWLEGTVSSASGPISIEYTARPSLLFFEGDTVTNDLILDFTDANGNDYPDKTTSATTVITSVAPAGDPRSLGFWRNHSELWSSELLARIQATDDRFDGADGSTPDGELSIDEVKKVLKPGGKVLKVLKMQLLATYFSLATSDINADTTIESITADVLGLDNVRDAVEFASDTLLLPVNKINRDMYSDAILILDEINNNFSEIY